MIIITVPIVEDVILLCFKLLSNVLLNYLILNSNGQIIKYIDNISPNKEIEISISELKPGIYILMLSTIDGISLNKFNKL